jgi:hypothetical protein
MPIFMDYHDDLKLPCGPWRPLPPYSQIRMMGMRQRATVQSEMPPRRPPGGHVIARIWRDVAAEFD